ncbi:nitroreductase family deazaflavin-dependent oxidoreductase [Nocardia jejuensis]|uniref:nitroreductase family deazaflavin-dependent oxidoreductase n=1 Tax=Nocardia jejuensis TaxID=328049 RepID=UPI00082C290A|nr:nitroreductase family deazaflavin-dependent oxidoreductase [Nocardia jejuensis]
MAPNPLPPLARKLAQQRWLMRAAPLVMWLERMIRWVTRGRRGVLDVAGLPSLEITVVGRKSGLPRTTSLLTMPIDDGFRVMGSGWGSAKHPVWTTNLRAAETAVVMFRGRRSEVTVHELTGIERKLAWDDAVEFWPGYEMEYELSGHREFRIFELRRSEPARERRTS